MKTEQIDAVRPRAADKKKKQAQRALGTGIVATLLIVAALVYAGMRIERASYEKPLPANEACFKAATDQKAQLQASVNAQFGTPVPEGTPSADQVTKLLSDCESSRTQYNVQVEAAK